MAKEIKGRQRVEVTWTDITSYGGWRSPDDIGKVVPAVCQSVGYLVGRDSKHVRIAMNYDGDGTMGNVQVFPAKNVVKIRKIK